MGKANTKKKNQQQATSTRKKSKRTFFDSTETLRRSTRTFTPSEAMLNQIVEEYDIQQRRTTAKRNEVKGALVPSPVESSRGEEKVTTPASKQTGATKKSAQNVSSVVTTKPDKIKLQKRIAKAKEDGTVGRNAPMKPRGKTSAITSITTKRTPSTSKTAKARHLKAVVPDPIINTRGLAKDLLRVAAIPHKHRLFGETLKMIAKTKKQQDRLLSIKAVSEVTNSKAKSQKEKKPKAVKAARNPVKQAVVDTPSPSNTSLVSNRVSNSIRNKGITNTKSQAAERTIINSEVVVAKDRKTIILMIKAKTSSKKNK
jgi:hypothetical protein